MDSLDLSALAASLETYSRDNQEHLFDRAMLPGVDAGIEGTAVVPLVDYMTVMAASDEVVLTNLQVGDVVQPGNKDTFDPTANAVKFKARIGKVRPLKVDLQFKQTQITALYKSYMGQVRAKRIDPTVIPFEEYIMSRVVAKIQENIRVQTVFNGVYNKAGSGPLDVADGIRTQVLAAIAAGDVPAKNIIDTAVIDATNSVAENEKIIAGIPDADFYGGLICVCSRAYKSNYESNYRKLYGTLPYNSGQLKDKIVGTDIPFVVEPGLSNFARPIFTKPGNLVYLYDDLAGRNTLAADYSVRTRDIAWVMDAQVGAGIAVAEHIWTNDGI